MIGGEAQKSIGYSGVNGTPIDTATVSTIKVTVTKIGDRTKVIIGKSSVQNAVPADGRARTTTRRYKVLETKTQGSALRARTEGAASITSTIAPTT